MVTSGKPRETVGSQWAEPSGIFAALSPYGVIIWVSNKNPVGFP